MRKVKIKSLPKAQTQGPIEGKITPAMAKETLEYLDYAANQYASLKEQEERIQQERDAIKKMWEEHVPEPPVYKKRKTLFGRPYQIVEVDAGPDEFGFRKPGEKTRVKTIYYKNGNIAKTIIENNEKGVDEITWHDKDGNVTAENTYNGHRTFSNGYFDIENNVDFEGVKRRMNESESFAYKNKLDAFLKTAKLNLENMSREGSQPGNSFNTVWPDWENDRFNYTRTKNPDVKKSHAKFEYGGVPMAQTGVPDWRDFLRREMKVAPAQNLVGDVRKVKVQPAVAESTRPANTPKAPATWKDKSGKQLIEEAKMQEAYEALPEELKRQDVLTADTRSDAEKFARRAWTALSQPMETIAAVNRGYDIPSGYMGMHDAYEGYNVGSPMTTVVDMAAGFPAFVANAAYRQGEQLVNDPLNYIYTMSPFGMLDPNTQGQALSNVLDLAAVIPVAKTASPLIKGAAKSLITRTGEVKNIIMPPKISMNDASLYDAGKSKQVLKYIFDPELNINSKEWDVKSWAKKANKQVSEIKDMYQPDLNALRVKMMDVWAKFGANSQEFRDAQYKLRMFQGRMDSEISNVVNPFYQKLANKLDYPVNLQNLGSMRGGFGTVVPTTHDPGKLVKFGTIMDYEAAAPKIFEKLDMFGRASTDPHIGLPLKSHVFPGLTLDISSNQGAGSVVQILPKVPGKSLADFVRANPKNLDILKAGITPESVDNLVNRLNGLQANNLGIDWQNPNNFLFDPVTGEFGIVDISAMPMSVTGPSGDAIRWFNTTGLNYGDIFEKAIGAVKGDPLRASRPIRFVPHQIEPMLMRDANYSIRREASGYPRVWGKNQQGTQTWQSIFEQEGGLISSKKKKKEAGFQILTDTNGKYVFVKT